MSNSWSKEDRVHFENSEVMKELEKNVVDNYKKLQLIQEKIASIPKVTEIKETTQALNELNQAMKELNAADDDIDSDKADVSSDHEDNSDDDNLADKEAVLKDLRNMIKIALEQKEYDLVYKIERTIDSITDKEVVCE
tara:strand:- start:800 stop:1213 length:414 start_codon:yes stop_codon:yes gene_type:complete